MIPAVEIRKADFSTGVVRPSVEGVAAVIAPAEKGALNTPLQVMRRDTAVDEYGYGPLSEDGAYIMKESGHPVVLIRGDASTAGDYGTVTTTGGGTSAITEGATEPLDGYDVVVKFIDAGTIGVTGITYQYSLDGGLHYSAKKALGTANTIAIPNTGVSLALGAGTILAGETVEVSTTGPQLASTDLPDALEALRVSNLPWEVLFIDAPADAALVALVDAWLEELEAAGKFRAFVTNTRFRNRATPETEAAYRTAMQTATASMASIRGTVAADGGDLTSVITGVVQTRPAALGLVGRAMAVDISTEPAYKADGPIAGFQLADARGNPKYHDEYLYPGLDDLRLATFRTFPGEEGLAYITNSNLTSPLNSDYVFLPHARVMNRLCEVAYQLLSTRLSKGVRKQRKPAPGGAVYILEDEALDIESYVQVGVEKVAKGRASGVVFSLMRDDDISSNAGAEINASLAVASLAYIKKFKVTAKFAPAV